VDDLGRYPRFIPPVRDFWLHTVGGSLLLGIQTNFWFGRNLPSLSPVYN